MSKKTFTAQEYDQLIDTFAQKLWFLHELWLGIKEIRAQAKERSSVNSEYRVFFSWVYRSFVHEFYNGICRLVVDEAREVESLIRLLKKRAADKPRIENEEWGEKLIVLEKDLVREIENHPTLEKIKNYRDNVMCHQNSRLIFDPEFSKEFYERNNPTPEEIESLLHSLGTILKKAAMRASFSPLTLPITPVRLEIKKIFTTLAKELEVSLDSVDRVAVQEPS